MNLCSEVVAKNVKQTINWVKQQLFLLLRGAGCINNMWFVVKICFRTGSNIWFQNTHEIMISISKSSRTLAGLYINHQACTSTIALAKCSNIIKNIFKTYTLKFDINVVENLWDVISPKTGGLSHFNPHIYQLRNGPTKWNSMIQYIFRSNMLKGLQKIKYLKDVSNLGPHCAGVCT